MSFSEEDGGYGGGPIETMIVMEQFGKGLVVEPFLPTVVLGGGMIARAEQENGKPLIENQTFAEKIADLEIQVTALEYTELRVLSQMAHGGQPGPEVSGLKVRGSEIQQRIAELAMEAVGEYAAPYQPGMLFQDTNETPVGPDHAPPAAPRYFNMRKTSIYGGSNEIQKNIVSKMVLGL